MIYVDDNLRLTYVMDISNAVKCFLDRGFTLELGVQRWPGRQTAPALEVGCWVVLADF